MFYQSLFSGPLHLFECSICLRAAPFYAAFNAPEAGKRIDAVHTKPFQGTFNSKEQIDEALSVLEEAPYSEAELKKVQTCLKERIRGTSLKERIDTGKGLRQRPYILREEAADLMEVYPLSV